MGSLPVLATIRLTLQPVSFDDVETLHRLWTDPDVRRYLWDDQVISRERAEEYVRGTIEAGARTGLGTWLIHDAPGAEAVGFCGFSPRDEPGVGELIYGLAPEAWGRGYATESARVVVEHGFTVLGLSKIVASTDVPNTASARVLERLGMRFVRRNVVDGLDLVFYEIEQADRQGAA